MTKTADAAAAVAIRPFQVSVPDEDLVELRQRIVATRYPEKETVNDFTQGVPLATVKKLALYWATQYDWRKVEARPDRARQERRGRVRRRDSLDAGVRVFR